MVRPDLPAPTNGAEQYLAAILDGIDDVRARLPELPVTVEDPASPVVELQEPARPAAARRPTGKSAAPRGGRGRK
jgi:hypothetical protein